MHTQDASHDHKTLNCKPRASHGAPRQIGQGKTHCDRLLRSIECTYLCPGAPLEHPEVPNPSRFHCLGPNLQAPWTVSQQATRPCIC